MGTPRSADFGPGGATPRGDELGPRARGILDSVARVFADRGSAVSMTEIAARSGVGRATLYRHFPTREVLMVEFQRVAVQDVGQGLRAANLDAIDVPAALERAVRARGQAEGLLRPECTPAWLEDMFIGLIDAGLEQIVRRGADMDATARTVVGAYLAGAGATGG